jgi:hypothetical protein
LKKYLAKELEEELKRRDIARTDSAVMYNSSELLEEHKWNLGSVLEVSADQQTLTVQVLVRCLCVPVYSVCCSARVRACSLVLVLASYDLTLLLRRHW